MRDLLLHRGRRANSRRHFTLIEMLLIVVIILILTTMLMGGVDRAIAAAHLANCLSNQRQLAIAESHYTLDSNRYFTHPYTNNNMNYHYWVGAGESENSIKIGKLYPYTRDTGVYYCPSDEVHVWRSYSQNDQAGGGGWATSPATAKTVGQLERSPEEFFVFIEESDPRRAPYSENINSFVIRSDDLYSWSNADWIGSYHERQYNLAFFDGHAKNIKLDTDIAVLATGISGTLIPANNSDKIRLWDFYISR